MDKSKLKTKVLYTQVRVKTETKDGKGTVGGSGTIIYSKLNNEGTYSTYAVSCHHVIDEAISVKTEWAPMPIGRDVKKEYRKIVSVEFFDYDKVAHGHRPLNYSADGDIMAYDKDHDMALIKLRTVNQQPHIAKFLPLQREKEIDLGTKVCAVGCALLHDPIITFGEITHMGTEINYKDYWMSNASIIFGNSGGAVFLNEAGDDHFFLGIPSRVDVVGWGTPITHCNYFSPIHRIYKFLEEQQFQFIYDESFTEEQCEKMRKDREEMEKRKLALMPSSSTT